MTGTMRDEQVTRAFFEARDAVLEAQVVAEQQRVEAIQRVAEVTRQWYAGLGDELLGRAREVLEIGEPPRMRDLCGVSDLEKPMNRVLGWIFDPRGSHGAGALPLIALARRLGANLLAEDARIGPQLIEVYCEQSPRDFPSSKEPDLLVRSPRAALLLENKIHAPESGDQYGPYAEAFYKWAGDREHHLVLSAPTERDLPQGHDYQMLLHGDLARILGELAEDRELPLWSRITLTTLIRDLESDEGRPTVGRIRAIVDKARTDGEGIGPETSIELRNLIAAAGTGRPWEE